MLVFFKKNGLNNFKPLYFFNKVIQIIPVKIMYSSSSS